MNKLNNWAYCFALNHEGAGVGTIYYTERYFDKEAILLIDSWKDQESLDKHHESETMKKIIELRNKYDLHMKVEKFIPFDNNTQDDKYIRK